MLSTENPPPDLPCPCGEISQLKSSSNDEERASENTQQHNQLEVDLFKSGGLDDIKTNPLPKFSIRDYVFNTRNKDVKINWPFSLKNLQLCLKNGVKDVLPPFQPLALVRNPSVEKPSVDDEVEVRAEDTKNINSSGSEEDKRLPATTSSDQSCSDINSVPEVKTPSLEPETEYLPGSPSKKLELAAGATDKVKSSTQNPAKKCKLILKLKNIVEPKATEDLSANNFVVSDTMTTNVCPVCKTFSSSSNTTLNAHIDQCLSGESSVKWMTNSKAIKHRIKPRKSRLMVDIYDTAIQCTLEDLDKRNGTNWAANLGFPDEEEFGTYTEEKNETYASVNIEDNKQEGSVYIDSSGTKVRILSKLSDQPPNANVPGQSQTKLSRRDKVNELPSSKKKSVVQKLKIVKSPPCVQRSSPRLEVDGGQRKSFQSEGYKDDRMRPAEAFDQMKSDGIGMIKQWVGSKRSGHKRNINHERENWLPDIITKKSARSGASSLVERDGSSISPTSHDENITLLAESNKRKANMSCDPLDECSESPCQKKMQGLSYQECDDSRNQRAFSKPNLKQSRKDNPEILDLPSGTENYIFSQRNKRNVIKNSPVVNTESSFISSRSAKYVNEPEDKQFSSLKKKKLLSVSHALIPESKKKLGRKRLGFKNSTLHCPSRSEEMIQLRHEICRRENAAQSKKFSAKSFVDGTRVSKIKKKRAETITTSERDMASNSSEIPPESDSHGSDNKNDSFGCGDVSVLASTVLEKDKIHNEFSFEPTYKLVNGETFAAYGKSLETAFPRIDFPSDVGYVPQYNEAYEGHHLAEAPLGGKQEGFSEDKVGNGLISSRGGLVMVENEAQGNYFVDVDPIPIPGPPGSFLPSPGRMSSEELQGNSSLTACMQSSENGHQAVDMDSSDSPISVVSDSVAMRSNSVSVNLPEQSHNETQCDELMAKGSTSIEQAIIADRKSDDLYESKSGAALPEMTALRFKSTPPCCCSRKDVALLAVSFMNQELRQHSIASRIALQHEKKTPDGPKEKAYLFPAKDLNPEPGNFVPNSMFGCGPGLVSQHPESKFLFHSDREPPSPSTSNPVLRLMGKNLMVANKDENLSPQSWPTQSSMVINDAAALRLRVDASFSIGKNHDERHSFHATVSHGPSAFVNMQNGTSAQSFDFSSYDGFKTPTTVRSLWSSAHPSGVMFPNKTVGGNFVPSSAPYDVESIQNLVPYLRPADSSGAKHKEIIVIDEPPENEATNLAIKATPRELHKNMKFGESFVPSGLQCDSSRVNPFYNNYQTAGYPSPVVQNGNNQVQSALYFSPGFS